MAKRIYKIKDGIKCSFIGKITHLNNISPRRHPTKTTGTPTIKVAANIWAIAIKRFVKIENSSPSKIPFSSYI